MMTKEKEDFVAIAQSIEDELPAAPVNTSASVQADSEAQASFATAPISAQMPEQADGEAQAQMPVQTPVQTQTPAPEAQPNVAQKKASKAKRANHKQKAGGYQIQYSIGMKLLAFLTFLCMAVVSSLSVIAIATMLEHEFYVESRANLKENAFYSIIKDDLPQILISDLNKDEPLDVIYPAATLSVTLRNGKGDVLLRSGLEGTAQWNFVYQDLTSYANLADAIADEAVATVLRDPKGSIMISFEPNGGWTNDLDVANSLISHGYANRYYTILNLVLSAILGIFCFFYLFHAIGRTPRGGAVVLSDWTKIPFDVFTVGSAMAIVLPTACWIILAEGTTALLWWQIAVATGAAILALVAIILLFLLNCAVRCKCGDIWRNTLIYRLVAFFGRNLAKCLHWVASGCGYFLGQLPFIWKGIFIPLGMVLFNLILLWFCAERWYNGALYLTVTAIQVLLLAGGYGYALIAMNRLAEGGKALAAGDLSYQVDTKQLCFAFKEHAENINRMGGCLTEAVNEQLKSERMKTELITNVSHDIKTPLTSIINYADLLSKEEIDNATIEEYVEVISRQSCRLKRLIEDLVEASKASTGSVEVNLVPCEVGVLLSQAVGEYQQRLQEHALTLVAKQPEQPVSIMADGRHLWRVFDNLLENIYKYAQGGTRVYLSLEAQNGRAIITFKNISEYPLDISEEELMERFVRGDASRHNEGNGLGLSIAQSLTELQGGSLNLAIDGDLFKVTLAFDLLEHVAE